MGERRDDDHRTSDRACVELNEFMPWLTYTHLPADSLARS